MSVFVILLMKRRYWAGMIVGVPMVIIFVLLLVFTGFLQAAAVDDRDLAYWNYSDGLIDGASAFEIPGTNETCWILIHGYAATPLEMRELADVIGDEFGDRVVVVRLVGHGKVPSELRDLSLDDWYAQVSEVFEEMHGVCERVNVVGSSFGGALSLRLAEDYDVKNLFVLDVYLLPTYRWYMVFVPNSYLNVFSPMLDYAKKSKVSNINDPEGLKDFVAYWNFPFLPVKNSAEFLDEVYNNLIRIDDNILIQHSLWDSIADPDIAQDIFDKVSSENKRLVWFEDSDHIILADYDSDEAIANVVRFEKENR
jgi:carboxylesterase